MFVCLSVCLSISLLSTLCKNCWWDLHENFTAEISVDKEELIKFCKSSTSGSRSMNFLKDSLTLWNRAFFKICLISLENWLNYITTLLITQLIKNQHTTFRCQQADLRLRCEQDVRLLTSKRRMLIFYQLCNK